MNQYGRRRFLQDSGLAVGLATALPSSSLLRPFAFAAPSSWLMSKTRTERVLYCHPAKEKD